MRARLRAGEVGRGGAQHLSLALQVLVARRLALLLGLQLLQLLLSFTMLCPQLCRLHHTHHSRSANFAGPRIHDTTT